jgi:hypothetical protein
MEQQNIQKQDNSIAELKKKRNLIILISFFVCFIKLLLGLLSIGYDNDGIDFMFLKLWPIDLFILYIIFDHIIYQIVKIHIDLKFIAMALFVLYLLSIGRNSVEFGLFLFAPILVGIIYSIYYYIILIKRQKEKGDLVNTANIFLADLVNITIISCLVLLVFVAEQFAGFDPLDNFILAFFQTSILYIIFDRIIGLKRKNHIKIYLAMFCIFIVISFMMLVRVLALETFYGGRDWLNYLARDILSLTNDKSIFVYLIPIFTLLLYTIIEIAIHSILTRNVKYAIILLLFMFTANFTYNYYIMQNKYKVFFEEHCEETSHGATNEIAYYVCEDTSDDRIKTYCKFNGLDYRFSGGPWHKISYCGKDLSFLPPPCKEYRADICVDY